MRCALVIARRIGKDQESRGNPALGAMAVTPAPHIAGWTGGRVHLRILSNLADRHLTRAGLMEGCPKASCRQVDTG